MRPFQIALAILAISALSLPAAAQESKFDIGFQLNILGATGKPTNDILGYGISGRYKLSDRWWIGGGIDRSDEFDVERPIEFFGLRGDPAAGEVDAIGESTMVRAWAERVSLPGRKIEFFLGAGLGVNFVDIAPLEGPLEGGGTYRIVTSADDEYILTALAGLRWRLGERLAFEAALRVDEHIADWRLVDEVSGATTTIDDYSVRGVTLGLRYRF